jgi:glycosyltransferase involved in cell wall biosynthesis
MTTLKPTRVLVVTPLGEGGQGGIDRLMDELRHYLARNSNPNMDVQFATSRGQGSILASPFLVLKLLLRLSLKLIGKGPDVLHINLSSHGSTLRKLVIARVARFLDIPYSIHLHGSGFREYWNNASPFLSKRIKSMFLHANQTLVLGSVWREFIVSHVPEAKPRVRILPNAVPKARDRINRYSYPVKILFLGHVGQRKGVPDLVKALGLLPKNNNWQAIIAGNGEVDETRAEIAKLGLTNNVTLPGWVGTKDVAKLLHETDILVLPSYEENLPMSVIEGMAYGLAVITTPVGAVEDIMTSEVNGLLVPVGDISALSQGLLRLIESPDLRSSLGEAAQQFQRANLETEGYVKNLNTVWRDMNPKNGDIKCL